MLFVMYVCVFFAIVWTCCCGNVELELAQLEISGFLFSNTKEEEEQQPKGLSVALPHSLTKSLSLSVIRMCMSVCV